MTKTTLKLKLCQSCVDDAQKLQRTVEEVITKHELLFRPLRLRRCFPTFITSTNHSHLTDGQHGQESLTRDTVQTHEHLVFFIQRIKNLGCKCLLLTIILLQNTFGF